MWRRLSQLTSSDEERTRATRRAKLGLRASRQLWPVVNRVVAYDFGPGGGRWRRPLGSTRRYLWGRHLLPSQTSEDFGRRSITYRSNSSSPTQQYEPSSC